MFTAAALAQLLSSSEAFGLETRLARGVPSPAAPSVFPPRPCGADRCIRGDTEDVSGQMWPAPPGRCSVDIYLKCTEAIGFTAAAAA
jgi:hypothetical protein